MDTFFLLAVLSAVTYVSANLCDETPYFKCFKQVQEFTYKEDLIFGTNLDELHRECVTALSKLACVNRFAKRCLNAESRDEFLYEIAGPEELISSICSEENELRRSYIEIIPCLRNASDGLRYCRNKFEHNERDIGDAPYENKAHLRCCSFDGYRRCVRMLMELQTDCGENTADIAEEITLKMGGPKFLNACTDTFERCTGSGSTRAKSSLVLTSFVSIASLLPLLLFIFR